VNKVQNEKCEITIAASVASAYTEALCDGDTSQQMPRNSKTKSKDPFTVGSIMKL